MNSKKIGKIASMAAAIVFAANSLFGQEADIKNAGGNGPETVMMVRGKRSEIVDRLGRNQIMLPVAYTLGAPKAWTSFGVSSKSLQIVEQEESMYLWGKELQKVNEEKNSFSAGANYSRQVKDFIAGLSMERTGVKYKDGTTSGAFASRMGGMVMIGNHFFGGVAEFTWSSGTGGGPLSFTAPNITFMEGFKGSFAYALKFGKRNLGLSLVVPGEGTVFSAMANQSWLAGNPLNFSLGLASITGQRGNKIGMQIGSSFNKTNQGMKFGGAHMEYNLEMYIGKLEKGPLFKIEPFIRTEYNNLNMKANFKGGIGLEVYPFGNGRVVRIIPDASNVDQYMEQNGIYVPRKDIAGTTEAKAKMKILGEQLRRKVAAIDTAHRNGQRAHVKTGRLFVRSIA